MIGDANNLSSSFAGTINGTGSLTKAGSGTFTLSRANGYSGSTTIEQGALQLSSSSNNNIAATPSIDVASGATLDVSGITAAGGFQLNGAIGQTLAGDGTVVGSVFAAAGSEIAPGGSIGTLTMDQLTLMGATLDFGFDATPANDLIAVTESGGLAINSGSAYLYQEGTGDPFDTPGTYQLIEYTGAIQGNGVSGLSIADPQSGVNYSFSVDSELSDIDLTITAVPEPSGVALIAACMISLAFAFGRALANDFRGLAFAARIRRAVVIPCQDHVALVLTN